MYKFHHKTTVFLNYISRTAIDYIIYAFHFITFRFRSSSHYLPLKLVLLRRKFRLQTVTSQIVFKCAKKNAFGVCLLIDRGFKSHPQQNQNLL